MTRRRWIADEVSGNRAALIGEHAYHLVEVLRAKAGQQFDIATGTEVRRGTVSSVQPGRVDFDLGEVVEHAGKTVITVAISIFKFDRMEWAIEKCTELGVARIVPLVAGRSEPHLAAAASKRVERWRRIARQASEQSRRVSPPEIADPIKFAHVLTMPSAVKVVLDEVEERVLLKSAISPDAESVLLAFGPEGGWKEQESAASREAGWIGASLGPTILRAETAIIAAVAIASSILE